MPTSAFFGLPDFFAPGVATAFVLTALRVGGLLLVAPAWSAKSFPMKLRTALLVIFAVLLIPSATANADLATLRVTPTTFLSETVVGFVIGLAAAIVVAGAEFAGELMTTSIGLSGAAIFDPVNNTQGAILGAFMQMLAVTLLLMGGGHIIMLQAVAQSFVAMPLGAPIELGNGLLAVTKAGTTIFASGMQFAAPVIAAILVTNIALAVLGRAAPQLQIMSVAFPIQIGIGLLTFAGSLGLIVHALSDWTPAYARTLDSFARAVQVAPVPATGR
ncbi:MAG: flagellar biosynthetic protein FliR [Gemmatimonadota bacterium]|jgi:flagellar biosynthetic protein FliR|nr:flagellar biosynthetic protein FliR [Gemmatimonadota bacterium]